MSASPSRTPVMTTAPTTLTERIPLLLLSLALAMSPIATPASAAETSAHIARNHVNGGILD